MQLISRHRECLVPSDLPIHSALDTHPRWNDAGFLLPSHLGRSILLIQFKLTDIKEPFVTILCVFYLVCVPKNAPGLYIPKESYLIVCIYQSGLGTLRCANRSLYLIHG